MTSTVFLKKYKRGTWSISDYEDLHFLVRSIRLLRNHSKIPDMFMKILIEDIKKSGIDGFESADKYDEISRMHCDDSVDATSEPLIGKIFSGVLPTK